MMNIFTCVTFDGRVGVKNLSKHQQMDELARKPANKPPTPLAYFWNRLQNLSQIVSFHQMPTIGCSISKPNFCEAGS